MYPDSNSKQCTQPLDPRGSELFLLLSFAESGRKELTSAEYTEDLPFLSKIILKRIEAYSLPIQFTKESLLAVNCLCSTPGDAIILLVDCLNKFEKKLVTVKDLVTCYPWGFYTKDSVGDIIDNYMKPRKHKWSEIY